MTFVPADELTKIEREVVAAYGAGARLDLADRPDRTVRAESSPGCSPAATRWPAGSARACASTTPG